MNPSEVYNQCQLPDTHLSKTLPSILAHDMIWIVTKAQLPISKTIHILLGLSSCDGQEVVQAPGLLHLSKCDANHPNKHPPLLS